MKTKTKRLFSAAFAACLLLAGCSAPGPEAPAAEGGAIRFLSSDLSYGSGNETGYYYFTKDENGNSLLRVVDYATLQDVPLCSQPNCAHSGETCPAWFAWGGTEPSVLASDDALYILFSGAPWDGWAFETYGEKALPRILKCNTDGSGRQDLARFGASEAFASMPAADRQNLYIILADYSSAGGPVEKIVTIDLATGAASADKAVQRTELRIVGAWGRELILQSGLGRNYYAAYNVDTKALRDLAASDSAAAVGEGVLCCVDEATGAIRTVSVEDGSVTELATDLLAQCAPQWAKLAAVTEQGYVVQASGEDVYHNWLIDFGGRAVRQELQAESTEEGDRMRMLEIFARQGEDYLVSPSRSFHTVCIPGPNGVTYGVDVVDYAFALISEEDFWAGTPNYRAVSRAG
ncbi:hypothetical protein [Candidatus Allofournierella excrementigallinarum]|uniref:hypothetical protein n=1 Tax=Candidatus Allofournierella excrementigallinarum TaxID=2838592 RepID=UPI00374F4909